MELKIEHLAPYLPYKLEMISAAKGRSAYITTIKRRLKKVEVLTPELIEVMLFLRRKPILRPLSDLTKEIEVNGEKFVPVNEIEELFGHFELNHNPNLLHFALESWTTWLDLHMVTSKLFEWHFDVFNLIKEDLAIDINTLNQ